MEMNRHDRAFARFRAHGRPRDLAQVFDATAVELHRVARHLVGSEDAADDLVQATFLAAIEGRASFHEGERVLPWLLGILANRAHRHRRAHKRRPDPERLEFDEPEDPSQRAAHEELDASVREALLDMPEPYGSLLNMHLQLGLSATEIAERVQRPAGSVRKQLSRGMDRLRRALPAGFAGGAATVSTSLRSLAPVREAVLTAAADVATTGAAVTAGAASLAGGAKAMLIGAAALVTASVAWMAWPEGSPSAEATLAREHAVDASGETAVTVVGRADTTHEPPERTLLAGPGAPGHVETPDTSGRTPLDLAVTVREARSGEPVEDYRLRLFRASSFGQKAQSAAPAPEEQPRFVGDAHHPGGRYESSSLRPAAWCVQAVPVDDDLLPSEIRIAEVRDGAPVELELSVESAFSRDVLVVDHDGEPMPCTRLEVLRPMRGTAPDLMTRGVEWLAHPEHRPEALLIQDVETDMVGRAKLRGPDGPVVVRVTSFKHAPRILEDVLLSAPMLLEIRVDRGACIDIELESADVLFEHLLVDSRPERLSDFEWHPSVRLFDESMRTWFPLSHRPRVEPDGTARIEFVPPGDWTVRLHYSLYQEGQSSPSTGSVDIGSVRTTGDEQHRLRADVSSLRVAEWSGRVWLDGEALGPESGTIHFFPPPGEERPTVVVRADEHGRYAARLVAGRWTVELTPAAPDGERPPFVRLRADPIVVVAGQDVEHTLAFEARQLRLLVLRHDGTPAAHEPLRIETDDFAWLADVIADGQGIVELDRVPRAVLTVWPGYVMSQEAETQREDPKVQFLIDGPDEPLARIDLRHAPPGGPVTVRLPEDG